MIVEYVGEMVETGTKVVKGDEICGKVVEVSTIEVFIVDEMMVEVSKVEESIRCFAPLHP